MLTLSAMLLFACTKTTDVSNQELQKEILGSTGDSEEENLTPSVILSDGDTLHIVDHVQDSVITWGYDIIDDSYMPPPGGPENTWIKRSWHGDYCVCGHFRTLYIYTITTGLIRVTYLSTVNSSNCSGQVNPCSE